MRPGGFEPPTNSLEGCCSIHLSYGRAAAAENITRPRRLKLNDWSPQEEGHGKNRLAGGERAGHTGQARSRHDQRKPKEEREEDRGKPPERNEEVRRHRRKNVDGDPQSVR